MHRTCTNAQLILPALVLLGAATGASAACRPLSGDVFIDRVFDVAFTDAPDRFLGRVSGTLSLACDATDRRAELLPVFHGLRYARDIVNPDGGVDPAYEINATSPLIVLSFNYGACDEHDPECPIEEVEGGSIPFRDGIPQSVDIYGGGRRDVQVNLGIYSRGGPMRDVASVPVGTVSTSFGGSGGVHHVTTGFRFRAQTCAVAPQPVTLDPIDASTLDQLKIAGEKSFNVAVNCGASGRPLVLEMSDVHDSSSHGDILAPAPGSTTTGVALQVLQDGTPVRMRQPWSYGTTTGTIMSVPFSARYLRTPAELRTGAIRSEVSLLADYY
ncbi:fimbrial protein [Stenotrophomonas maltophilia]|uniref:fimbrial protein n=1 Tax=Stenotrophomonas maltophilia TaxID=40324 RepID=UPI00244B039B|nr:hypothetical protein [Stenotrophomonas maltophilia]MDH1687275.1 fimbrial protein [Stenotrophomonas maltophilia]